MLRGDSEADAIFITKIRRYEKIPPTARADSHRPRHPAVACAGLHRARPSGHKGPSGRLTGWGYALCCDVQIQTVLAITIHVSGVRFPPRVHCFRRKLMMEFKSWNLLVSWYLLVFSY